MEDTVASPIHSKRLEALCLEHDAWEQVDKIEFQRRARLLQSLWRQDRGLPLGTFRGKRRGALLEMPLAQETLAGYLTPTIREVVRREVLSSGRDRGKLFGQPRIFNNLLSSQPLCFNLFGELAEDTGLASAVFADLTEGRIEAVTAVEFEHSPGRGDTRYTRDRSAFDVFVRFNPPGGGRGFIGIEVKYHEGLGDPEAEHRPRYDEVAAQMGCFLPEKQDAVRRRPLEQIWRDHLLAGALRLVDEYDDGFFVFLHPEGNLACAEAVASYQGCLADTNTFAAWTLEQVVAALQRHTDAPWVEALYDRYLDFERIDRLVDDSGRKS